MLKRVHWLGLLLAAWAALLTGSARAAEENAKPQSYAVLVGVGEFNDKQIKPRPTAVADAQAFYDLLTDPAHVGAPAENVHLLISGTDEKRNAKPATKANILKALKEVTGKAGTNDHVYILFVGQGAASGDRTCFFAADSTFKDRGKNAVLAADVEQELKGFKSQNALTMIDVNLKGFESKESLAEPNVMDMVRAFLGTREREEQAAPHGRAVILANSGLAPTVTVGGHGLFTKVALDALKGKADSEGYEPDGVVTVDELIKYLEKEVPPLARKNGKTPEEQQQLPFVEFARTSHFVLSKNPAETAKVEGRLKKLAALESDQKITKEVYEEGARLLSRMPKLKAQQELRKDLQKLTDGDLAVNDFLAKRKEILAGMRITSEAAKSYALKTIRGIETVTGNYVKEVKTGDLTAQAIRGLYRRTDTKVTPELAEKLKKAKEMKRSDLIDLLSEAREALGKREDLENDRDVEISMQSAMARLDPYTTFIDKEQVRQMEATFTGQFTGIGIQIRRDLVRDGLLVVTPIKGSPAYKAGLKAGDLITKIRREVDSTGKKLDPPQDTSTKGLKVDEAVKLILGQAGTKVKLFVEREGAKEPIEFEITRGRVAVETVLGFTRKSDDSWDYYIDPKSKIAYIHLTQFARNSFIDMEKVVKQLDKEGVKGLIVDLRFNPGGYLDVARDICDMFIDDGLIVTIRPRVGEPTEMKGKQEGSHLSFPMVCLVNGGSASGSEILAACLQDHFRAVIMGERSFGKGSVQNIQRFPTGGEIKLTTATFWRPNGKNLNKSSTKGTPEEDWGVRPDPNFELKLSRQETDQLADHLRDREIIGKHDNKKTPKDFKDRQLDLAVQYLKGQIKMTASNPAKKGS